MNAKPKSSAIANDDAPMSQDRLLSIWRNFECLMGNSADIRETAQIRLVTSGKSGGQNVALMEAEDMRLLLLAVLNISKISNERWN